MKLHKTCGSCGTHTHVASKTIVDNKCPACGTAYPIVEGKGKRVPRQEEIDRTTGGQGWKQCEVETCKKFTAGGRSLNCVHCDHPFSKKGSKVEPTASTEENEIEGNEVAEIEYANVAVYPEGYEYPEHMKLRSCYAAAGLCPFRLRSNNEDVLPAEGAIKAWAFKVRSEILKTGVYLTNEALLRWAREELNADLRFGRKSEEMEYLRSVINEVPDIRLKKVAV